MRKSIATAVFLLPLLTSCGEGNSDRNKVQIQRTSSEGWTEFQRLFDTEKPNIPLAEALHKLFQSQYPTEVIDKKTNFSFQKSIMVDPAVTQQWSEARKTFIIANSSASMDPQFTQNTMNLNPAELNRSDAFNFQIDLNINSLVQSAALKALLKAFDDQINLDSQQIADDAVQSIKQINPTLILKIDSTKAIENRSERIDKITNYLRQADYVFKKYELNEKDQEKIFLYASVAATLAMTLEKNPTVIKIIQTTKNINELREKATKIVALTTAVTKYGQSLKSDTEKLGESTKTIFKKVRELNTEIDLDLSADAKPKARAMIKDLLFGDTSLDQKNNQKYTQEKSGFFERKRVLDADFNKFLLYAEKASNSLDNIINTTNEVTNTLGIKLDANTQKVMNTAIKINSGIKAANTVSHAFSKGGFVGALNALSSGPATIALSSFGSGLGGNASDPAILSELADIKESLQEIKVLQQEILDNQKKMMVMIKDLALVIEENHREEMMTLLDIREDLIDTKTAITDINEKAFYSCQAITSFALNKASYFIKSGSARILPSVHNLRINNVDLVKSTIQDVTKTPKTLVQFINNGSPENFKTCQQELSTTFMTLNFSKFNRAAWIDEDALGNTIRNGGKIFRSYYLPAFNYLRKIHGHQQAQWQMMTLHLPAKDTDTLSTYKNSYLFSSGPEDNLANLSTLTAVNKLEKYVTALLVLHPYLTIDFENWSKPLSTIITEGISEETHEKTRQMLTNSFERIQVAVAQEALLAGEPLLPNLSNEWNAIMREEKSCAEGQEMFCFVRENSLMMGNLLTFIINQRIVALSPARDSIAHKIAVYEKLLEDLNSLALFLGVFPQQLEKNEQGNVFLFLTKDKKIKIELPAPERVGRGRLQYTEGMNRLIALQHRVADEILKISPSAYYQNVKDQLALALFVK